MVRIRIKRTAKHWHSCTRWIPSSPMLFEQTPFLYISSPFGFLPGVGFPLTYQGQQLSVPQPTCCILFLPSGSGLQTQTLLFKAHSVSIAGYFQTGMSFPCTRNGPQPAGFACTFSRTWEPIQNCWQEMEVVGDKFLVQLCSYLVSGY